MPTPAAVADVPDAVLAGAAPLFVALTDGPAPPAPIATVLSPEPTVSVGLPGLAVAVVDDVGVDAVALAVPPPLDGVVVDGAVCGLRRGLGVGRRLLRDRVADAFLGDLRRGAVDAAGPVDLVVHAGDGQAAERGDVDRVVRSFDEDRRARAGEGDGVAHPLDLRALGPACDREALGHAFDDRPLAVGDHRKTQRGCRRHRADSQIKTHALLLSPVTGDAPGAENASA